MMVLSAVLDRLRKYHFFAKLKKCSFLQRQVTFLGHTIDSQGMHIHSSKLATAQQWPVPKSKKEVQSFIGFAQYFRQYIKDFSQIALPLTNLTKHDMPFSWSSECQAAFQQLKDALSHAPVLQIFDPKNPHIELHTDALQYALSGILYQQDNGKLRPIAFHSRKFNAPESNYSTTDKELLAIVDSCRHFRHYIYNASLIVRTDHRPLEHYFAKNNLSPRQLRWAEYLADYDLKILYLAGRANTPADALSRIDLGLSFGNLSLVHSEIDQSSIAQLQGEDASLTSFRQLAASTDSRFYLKDGILFTAQH